MDTTKPPPQFRNWEMLAGWLRAEWLNIDHEEFPLHRGIYEGYASVAKIVSEAPPEEREARLYQFLTETLMTCGTEDAPEQP